MEYSWMPNCQNSCGGHVNTKCKDMDIGCMCADQKYILTSLCCLSETCGAIGVSYAKTYIKRYCEDWKVTPPSMDNLDCEQAASSSLIATTATSTATTNSATSSTSQSSDSTNGKSETGPNIGLIGGVAGGVGALLLALIGAAIFFYCRRKKESEKKREAAVKASQVDNKIPPPSSGNASTLEAVQMNELAPSYPPPSAYGYNQAGSQGWQQQYPGPPSYNASSENVQTVSSYSPLGNGGYWSELGTSGARPHGSELAGRPMFPPQPELQGMSFATRNPYPSELPPSEPPYQR